ncbi:aldose epimerase [Leptolyngbya sp. BL0902]|uniref:aldose epimerase family protein n=1 Tax=Leptolyngbya sp. BL0902 TaxID=1115757 RepID=UPI0018E8E178|nr:aldose epimerase [Leptolyngbya sp. BL0902]QQE65632.1 aldose epimerase [Leptolyngbya sp. BL0902]
MFAVALKAGPTSTYLLSDLETSSQLELVPQRGGLVTRWRVEGQEILYFDEARFADPALSVRGGIPILFPICGNLPDNQYSLDSQTYHLKQHGFARDLPWQATGQATTNAASLTLELSSSADTLAQYPFAFKLSFTFILRGHRLELQQQFTNLSDRAMPFSTGLHPYFQVSDKHQLEFEVPATEFQNHLTGQVESFGGQFDFSQPEIDLAFQNLTAKAATVTDRHLRRRLTLSWSEAYTRLVFWTVQGKDYYCLEPWTAPRNALNSGDSLLLVAPQQTVETSVHLAVAFW